MRPSYQCGLPAFSALLLLCGACASLSYRKLPAPLNCRFPARLHRASSRARLPRNSHHLFATLSMLVTLRLGIFRNFSLGLLLVLERRRTAGGLVYFYRSMRRRMVGLQSVPEGPFTTFSLCSRHSQSHRRLFLQACDNSHRRLKLSCCWRLLDPTAIGTQSSSVSGPVSSHYRSVNRMLSLRNTEYPQRLLWVGSAIYPYSWYRWFMSDKVLTGTCDSRISSALEFRRRTERSVEFFQRQRRIFGLQHLACLCAIPPAVILSRWKRVEERREGLSSGTLIHAINICCAWPKRCRNAFLDRCHTFCEIAPTCNFSTICGNYLCSSGIYVCRSSDAIHLCSTGRISCQGSCRASYRVARSNASHRSYRGLPGARPCVASKYEPSSNSEIAFACRLTLFTFIDRQVILVLLSFLTAFVGSLTDNKRQYVSRNNSAQPRKRIAFGYTERTILQLRPRASSKKCKAVDMSAAIPSAKLSGDRKIQTRSFDR
eukprot:284818890_6